MLCLSYYLLCFLFNKIGEEGKTGLPGREGLWGHICKKKKKTDESIDLSAH
jgi:hypothetical protein